MEPIVLATWGLVGVTALLVIMSALQHRSIRSQADAADKRDREQMAILQRQAEALAASARASQAMADEMIKATRRTEIDDLFQGRPR